MPGVFQDTVFSALVRAVLGPKYFAHIDEVDAPCVYQKTVHFPKSSATATSLGANLCDRVDPFNNNGQDPAIYIKPEVRPSDTDLESSGDLTKPAKEPALEPVKIEGTDSMLVTWYGPDDPEVCPGCRFVLHRIDFFCEEPDELVASQENLGHVSSLLSDFLCLLWLCSLYCRGQRRLGTIPCQFRCRDTWAYIIPARVWNW